MVIEARGSETVLDTRALEKALRERVDGEVRFDAGSWGAYATDGSNYRQVPIGVVVPRTIDAGADAVAVCAAFAAPLLSRGGGTSLGGQCTNTAVVIDWTKYCDNALSIDAAQRTCVVEPGIVLDKLNRRLYDQKLQFGPKPSTHSHCSIGGMIGNNSCGGSAQAYGKTVDNVRRLEILTYDGTRCWVGPTSEDEYAVLGAPGIAGLGKRLAGVAAERDAPVFAEESFVQWRQARGSAEPDQSDPRTVLLWPDTFSTYFHPSVVKSVVRVLEDAGFHVTVPTRAVCCGLTWISTSQLATTKRVLRRTLDIMRPWLEAGTPVVGLEPSCTAVFRSDAPELMPDDQDVRCLAAQFRTFAEQLLNHAPEGRRPPSLTRAATVQTHCHQHAVTKDDADRELMRRAGIDASVLDAGCCGPGGNFGFEQGHYDLSMTVAEQGVLPAVRDTDPGALVLADGFSCRTQIEQDDIGRRALHLAEALALAMDSQHLPADHPEKLTDRPEGSARDGRLPAAGVAACALGATAAGTYWFRNRQSAR